MGVLRDLHVVVASLPLRRHAEHVAELAAANPAEPRLEKAKEFFFSFPPAYVGQSPGATGNLGFLSIRYVPVLML